LKNHEEKKMPYSAVDLHQVKTVPLPARQNRVGTENLVFPNSSVEPFDTLDFREIVERILTARRAGKPVVWMQGAHVIKCGLAPVIIDLLKKGFIQHIASNGAATIHDFEIALLGHTSEDVAQSLKDGTFGMAEETGAMMNRAIQYGSKNGMGIGESLGEMIGTEACFAEHRDVSLLYNAWKLGIPYTVHVAVGTDIIHQHPAADFAAIGWGTGQDFKIFCQSICHLEGGVFLNFGSSVIGPEVFLKAVSIARNLGNPLKVFTTANFDLVDLGDYREPLGEDKVQYYYRPRKNIVNRPVMLGGKGFHVCGNHRQTIPNLHKLLTSGGDIFPIESQRIQINPIEKLRMDVKQILEQAVQMHPALESCKDQIACAYQLIRHCYITGGILFLAGNGGSMADALHISGELGKAFKIHRQIPDGLKERLSELKDGDILAKNLEPAFRAYVLGLNPVLRSAIENDYQDSDLSIAQELYAMSRPGDVLLSISTSGNAVNLHHAANLAKTLGVSVIGLSGAKGGLMRNDADIFISVEADRTDEIQNLHILVYHTLCSMIEQDFYQ
jgi:phosphoheptose isomerase